MKKMSIFDKHYSLIIVSSILLFSFILAVSLENLRVVMKRHTNFEICEKLKEQNSPIFHKFEKVKLRQTGEEVRMLSVSFLEECPNFPHSFQVVLPEGIRISVSAEELEVVE